MKLPRIFTTLAAACALAISTFILTGCQNEAQRAADKKWIAQRAAQLVGKKNPDTGKPYTSDEATRAAQAEDTFASKAAGAVVYGPAIGTMEALSDTYNISHSPSVFNNPTPPSMTAYPSPQVCPPTHMH